MTPQRDSYKKSISKYLDFITENSTTHGGSWISMVKWTPFKVLLQGLLISLQASMLIFVIFMVLFETPWTMKNTSMTTEKADVLDYPAFTICNPRPFDKQTATELNLSTEDLTLLALPSFFRDAENIYNEYFRNQSRFDIKLTAIASKHNLTTLIDKVLVKCESFLLHCNKKSLLSDYSDCCKEIFEPKPYLSTFGVCFSTKSNIGSSKDGTLQVLLNVSEEYTIGIHEIGGPRRSIVPHTLAFNGHDHPLVALERKPMTLVPGTYSTFKLKAREVS